MFSTRIEMILIIILFIEWAVYKFTALALNVQNSILPDLTPD